MPNSWSGLSDVWSFLTNPPKSGEDPTKGLPSPPKAPGPRLARPIEKQGLSPDLATLQQANAPYPLYWNESQLDGEGLPPEPFPPSPYGAEPGLEGMKRGLRSGTPILSSGARGDTLPGDELPGESTLGLLQEAMNPSELRDPQATGGPRIGAVPPPVRPRNQVTRRPVSRTSSIVERPAPPKVRGASDMPDDEELLAMLNSFGLNSEGTQGGPLHRGFPEPSLANMPADVEAPPEWQGPREDPEWQGPKKKRGLFGKIGSGFKKVGSVFT